MPKAKLNATENSTSKASTSTHKSATKPTTEKKSTRTPRKNSKSTAITEFKQVGFLKDQAESPVHEPNDEEMQFEAEIMRQSDQPSALASRKAANLTGLVKKSNLAQHFKIEIDQTNTHLNGLTGNNPDLSAVLKFKITSLDHTQNAVSDLNWYQLTQLIKLLKDSAEMGKL